MKLYLVRHAQSMPNKWQPVSDWPLSGIGARQAEQLAELLASLGIAQAFSSPFIRSLQTAMPFARKTGLGISMVEDLRERFITPPGELPSDEVWCRSWTDFSFAVEGCETSRAAQARIYRAIWQIAQSANDPCAIFTHGNVMGLFLNALAGSVGRKEAEALMNPDVLKIEWHGGVFNWDRQFRLAGLEGFATKHGQTPREGDAGRPNPAAAAAAVPPLMCDVLQPTGGAR